MAYTTLLLTTLFSLPAVSRADNLPPASACSFEALTEVATKEADCTQPIFNGVSDETCCQLTDKYLGKESSHPTGSCLCVDGVIDSVKAIAPGFSTFLAKCNSGLGSKIGFLGGGENFCPGGSGVSETQVIPALKKRTFDQWVADLGEEPILLWTSILAIPGAVGSLAFIWAGLVSLV